MALRASGSLNGTAVAVRALAAAVVVLLAGCASGLGGGVTHYFGWVRVEEPRSSDREIVANRYTAIGLRVDHGLGVGYMRDQKIYVPLTCRLIVLVRNQGELDRAIDQLQAVFGTEGVCVSHVGD